MGALLHFFELHCYGHHLNWQQFVCIKAKTAKEQKHVTPDKLQHLVLGEEKNIHNFFLTRIRIFVRLFIFCIFQFPLWFAMKSEKLCLALVIIVCLSISYLRAICNSALPTSRHSPIRRIFIANAICSQNQNIMHWLRLSHTTQVQMILSWTFACLIRLSFIRSDDQCCP